MLGIASVFFAARVFGGKPVLALLSYQFFYTLFYGSIIGILIGFLALFWWAMAHHHWELAGLALVLGCAKFQIGIPIGCTLWLLSNASWRDRVRVLAVPILVAGLSLLVYPGWVMGLIQRMGADPPNDWGSISLWRWIGPWVLLFWIPVLALPLIPQKRAIAVIAAAALGLPYFQQQDLIALYIFPVGWPALLGNLGFLFGIFEFKVLPLLGIVPLVIYMRIIVPACIEMVKKRRESLSRPL